MLKVTRVEAPAGSQREKYVQGRLMAALQDGQSVMLVNVNPFREPFRLFIGSLQGSVRTPTQSVEARPRHGGWQLQYVSLCRSSGGRRVEPDELANAELLAQLEPPQGPRGALVILDGRQGAGLRVRPVLTQLAARSLAAGCQVVALGSSASAPQWLADISEPPVSLASKYSATSSRLNADWLLASRSWTP